MNKSTLLFIILTILAFGAAIKYRMPYCHASQSIGAFCKQAINPASSPASQAAIADYYHGIAEANKRSK